MRIKSELLGKEVLDAEIQIVGKISDVVFDKVTFEITDLVIKKTGFSEQIKASENVIPMELVKVIEGSVPYKYFREHHPERKIFQAIRIEVNHELDVLESVLPDAIDLLNKNGRISVITFHSLEDRIVKNTFKEVTKENELYKGMPNIPDEYKAKYKLIGKFKPSKEELENNNRSRSAILRVIERI